jgi:hypothetical protein
MDVLILALLIAGAVCFLLATVNVPGRINLVALGLLCWIITVLIPAVQKNS